VRGHDMTGVVYVAPIGRPKRAHVLVHNSTSCVFHSSTLMDIWRIALLGDGGVGKTALAVQVSEPYLALCNG